MGGFFIALNLWERDMSLSYAEFIEQKRILEKPVGFGADASLLPANLFDWQAEIVKQSCQIGRSAIFAACGLGKSAMQLSWALQVAHHTRKNVLILAPLAVGAQTVDEGRKFGITARYIRSMGEIDESCSVYIMNYEMLDHVDASLFGGIVLDESSILKSLMGKTRAKLIRIFSDTPYKLCCTATPAPNDYTELGNHAEFLGITTTGKMLATWFVNDGMESNTWRLKKHAVKDFWAWVSSWAIALNKPSDMGSEYNDDTFTLPPLKTHKHHIKNTDGYLTNGTLIPMDGINATSIKRQMRSTLAYRIEYAAELVQKHPDESWLIWCELNQESEEATKAIPNAVEITGSMPSEEKARKMLDFASGKIKILVTKPKIAGFGMNWQICHNIIFIGASFSFESYYQAVRRCWRFGQEHEVQCHVILCNNETKIFAAVEAKERKYTAMALGMSNSSSKDRIVRMNTPYESRKIRLPHFLKPHGATTWSKNISTIGTQSTMAIAATL